jgi:glycogen synthase
LSNLVIVLKEFLKTTSSSLPGVIHHFLSLPTDIKNSFATVISSNANLNVNNTLNNLKNGEYTENVSKILFTSENINSNSQVDENQMSELSNNIRFTRFNNPLISYDYKCGNYIGS